MLSIEGTRSYGIGLARAAKAAGIPVIEAEQPSRKDRRGRGKSDPIDAHLAVLYAIGLDADKLPRADGDREALRILLCAREEMATTSTGHINRLKALLRDGDDTDRRLARAKFTDTTLSGLARRHLPREVSREQAVRHSEIRRLALSNDQNLWMASEKGEPSRRMIWRSKNSDQGPASARWFGKVRPCSS